MKVKLEPGARLPSRNYPTDAGLDLYSRECKTIYPRNMVALTDEDIPVAAEIGETFDTGVHMAIPDGYFGKVESRSGLNVNHSIVSCGGVIDSSYRGSIKVKLYNLGNKPYTVKIGDRIAQLVIQPCDLSELEIVSCLDETERADNGFGSSGR